MGLSRVRHGLGKTRFFSETQGFSRIIMGCHGYVMGESWVCHG